MPLSSQARWNVALAAAALAATVVLGLRSEDAAGVEIERRDPAPGVDERRAYIAGAVLQPGVVPIGPGDRVIDALARAGGPASDADTTALNLSRRLVDEDHIVVPRRGDRTALLDVNRASTRELEALPGVGPATAAAVVAGRERDGPYRSTDDLVTRAVVTAHVYAQIRDLVRAP